MGIDEKIKKTVTAFKVYEFPTSGSCDGHIHEREGEGEEKRRVPFPWVEIYAPEPKGWQKNEEKKKEWSIENFKQQQKMMDFLSEFYQGRETPFDARLTFRMIGAFGGFRVQSFGAEMVKLLSLEEQKQKLELYRKEMYDFTKFLKDKHLSKE